ncbi:MAG: GGDEF domain-containing protein, partial [Mariprofundaceae bacterium]|nr:GGDEF domain-containing protein [Mariprofundaceae bacterium]
QKRVLDIASAHLRIITTTLDQFRKLENLAAIDPLCGIYNRRIFNEKLQEEVSRCRRNASGHLSCAFIDVDDFKSVNDRYSHLAGDETLKHVVACIRQCIRESDTIARYGGDEFVLLLPSDSSDDIAHVHHIGERILQRIATTRTPDYPDISVSVSIGIATQSSSTVDAVTLLTQADKAACQAKNSGKGKIKSVMQ